MTSRILHPLLSLLSSVTRQELARQVAYLKEENRVLRERLPKRRSAVEPKIGHLKSDNRMGRCFLKGLVGDEINAILAAAGSNLQKLLRAIAPALFFELWSVLFRSHLTQFTFNRRRFAVA